MTGIAELAEILANDSEIQSLRVKIHDITGKWEPFSFYQHGTIDRYRQSLREKLANLKKDERDKNQK